MTLYPDTSFLASLYLKDLHSQRAWTAIASRPQMWLTAVQRAEFANAVAQHVFRRVITEVEAKAINGQFERDRTSGLWSEVGLPENTFELCIDLARRYTPQFGIRTLDILHVASALELKAAQFWTLDDRQAKLAKEALAIFARGFVRSTMSGYGEEIRAANEERSRSWLQLLRRPLW